MNDSPPTAQTLSTPPAPLNLPCLDLMDKSRVMGMSQGNAHEPKRKQHPGSQMQTSPARPVKDRHYFTKNRIAFLFHLPDYARPMFMNLKTTVLAVVCSLGV